MVPPTNFDTRVQKVRDIIQRSEFASRNAAHEVEVYSVWLATVTG
jgi:hypothetical protein